MSAVLEPPPRVIFYPESDGKPMGETDSHRNLMAHLIDTLKIRFQDLADVYVTGNIMFYYVEGEPRKTISPDVMVCFGVEKKLRRTYKLWEERAPSVVFEISSRATWDEDLEKKLRLYAEMGVAEYYVFDPEYDYLDEPLLAYRLANGKYVKSEAVNGCIYSPLLDLELVDTGDTLRLRDPRTGEWLLSTIEQHIALQREQTAREAAEAEVALLRAELERLKQA